MVKKMKIPSISKSQETNSTSWKWPPFSLEAFPFQAKVSSFRNFYLALCDAAKLMAMLNSSWSQSKTISLTLKEPKEDLLEIAVNKAIRSKRLFFEPGGTSSILDNHHDDEANKSPFPQCVALAIESEDPYVDFRNSMEETVETCGLKHWEDVEELLAWYLRMNGKQHHCFIIEAFVDLFSGAPSCFSCPISHNDSASSSKSEDLWVVEANRLQPYMEKGKSPKNT